MHSLCRVDARIYFSINLQIYNNSIQKRIFIRTPFSSSLSSIEWNRQINHDRNESGFYTNQCKDDYFRCSALEKTKSEFNNFYNSSAIILWFQEHKDNTGKSMIINFHKDLWFCKPRICEAQISFCIRDCVFKLFFDIYSFQIQVCWKKFFHYKISAIGFTFPSLKNNSIII